MLFQIASTMTPISATATAVGDPAGMRLADVADRLEPFITGGLVATWVCLDAVALYSARSADEYEQVRADRRAGYEYLPTDDVHWQPRSTRNAPWLARGGIERWASPTC